MSPDARGRDPLVILGTSGSSDYLRDGTGSRRFWLLDEPFKRAGSPEDDQLRAKVRDRLSHLHDPAEGARRCALVACTAVGRGVDTRGSSDFRGDLVTIDDEGHGEVRRDDGREIE